jgi:hypothetical protein
VNVLAYDVAAGSFKAVVDHPSRSKSSTDAVAAHFGFTRRRFQSGELDNPGQTSRGVGADVCSTWRV